MIANLIAHAPELVALAGRYWLYAVIAAGVAMIFESAKPRLQDGEAEEEGGLARGVVALSSLLTPFLLLVHAYWAMIQAHRPDALLIALAAVFGAVILASVIGMIIGAAIPALGHILRRVSPFVSIAALAFTIWVTWANADAVLNAYVLSRT